MTEAEIQRAQRFSIPLPLLYRPAGHENWKQGTVENISRSGVLFRAPEEVPPQTAVDITLLLENPQNEEPPEVLCWGVIVRAESREQDPLLLAARIVHYDFVRPEARKALAVALLRATGDQPSN